jgi:hypothetical protein
MTTRTSASLRQAFKRFVELVKPIEDVKHVIAFDDGGPEIFTYITRLDEGVSERVHQAESAIMQDYPDLQVLFHVRYLEGRLLDKRALPPLTYSKGALPQRSGR